MTIARMAFGVAMLAIVASSAFGADDRVTGNSGAEPRNLNKWESGLDLKYGSVIEKSTPQLSAQWLRRFLTGTRVGATLSALPSSVDRREADGSKTRVNLLYGGLVVEQVFWEDFPYRLSASIAGGQGKVYVRNEVAGRADVFKQPSFNFFEATANGYFYNYKHLDLGVAVGFRSATMNDEDLVENGDVSGVLFGLSFRHII